MTPNIPTQRTPRLIDDEVFARAVQAIPSSQHDSHEEAKVDHGEEDIVHTEQLSRVGICQREARRLSSRGSHSSVVTMMSLNFRHDEIYLPGNTRH